MAFTMVSVCPLLLPVRGSEETILIVPLSWPPPAAAGDAAAAGEETTAGDADAAGEAAAAGDDAAAGDAPAAGDDAAAGDAPAAGDAAAGAVVGFGVSAGFAGALVGVVGAPDEQAASNAAPPAISTASRRNIRRERRVRWSIVE